MKFGKGYWKSFESGIEREYVITNGLGGYCGSSIIGANTRMHHGLLIASLHAPIKREMILSKINEKVNIDGRMYDLNSSQYKSEIISNGQHCLQRFEYTSHPIFKYQMEDFFMEKEIVMDMGKNTTVVKYSIVNGRNFSNLEVTPNFNFRDHGEVSRIDDLKYLFSVDSENKIIVNSNVKKYKVKFFSEEGEITENIDKIEKNIEYPTEIKYGNPSIDNYFKPYLINIALNPFEKKEFYMVCSIEDEIPSDLKLVYDNYVNRRLELVEKAGYEDEFADTLVLAADQFIAYRKSTGLNTVLAGLPWFADWGRDTMIALQGVTLSTKRFEDTREILGTFAKYVKDGIVPNMFPDEGSALYNTVDASLWYFYSVHKYLEYTGGEEDYKFVQNVIYPKLVDIVDAYRKGTKFSIYMDDDGLIHAGSGVDQVTWMDVRVGEWVVTPRHGKPVEINALWYNALKVMEKLSKKFSHDSDEYSKLSEKVKESFNLKFWNEDKDCLFDVVDENDDKIRPNQIWAVSLPYTMLNLDKSKKIVDIVISHLYASYGLRSLSPFDKDYIGVYSGELIMRDAAYHQGTTWGFPLGGLITAYCKINNHSEESIEFARKLLMPVEDHLRDGCIGSIAEIFDGQEPIISRGCYAQAWSVGEVLRAYSEDILLKGK